jgi:ABC-type sugar transport system permease subunit
MIAFAVLITAVSWVGGHAAQRWDRGLDEDRVIYRAFAFARAAARLVEAGHGEVTPHLRAYGNAVGTSTESVDVHRLVVIDTGAPDQFGVRRGASTIWSLHGHTGPISPIDGALADRANHLGDHFESERAGKPIRLTHLVEVATNEPGWLRVAAYAPVVIDGKMRGMAGALLRVPADEALAPTAIWLMGFMVFVVFVIGLYVLPGQATLVLGGAVAALVLVLPFWVPERVNARVTEHLEERASDWLSVQAMADVWEPIALVAPIADRESWSADGAIRLEREPSEPAGFEVGNRRIGGPLASVHLHDTVATELQRGFDSSVLIWGLLAGLLVAFMVGPLTRLFINLRTDPGVYAYVSPAVLGLMVLVFLPFITGVGLSFYRYHLEGNAYEFIGFGNFAEIVAPDETSDMHFWRTLGVTIMWTTFNVVLHVAIGLGLALVLNRKKLFGKGLYRVLLILPWAVPSYITALLWRAMFIGEQGPINRLLAGAGFGTVRWFDDTFWHNFIPNLVTNTWLGFPFMMVVSMGALQSIPKDLYEAAALDGASAWDRFRHITVPLLRPALLPAVVLGTIWTFNLFNVIYLVSMGAGHTEILITEAYRAFHEQHRHGFAAAYSVMIFLILLAYTWVTSRVSKAAEGAIT